MTNNYPIVPSKSSELTAATTSPSRAMTVECSEVAGIAIGEHMGQFIKRPIAGLALIAHEQIAAKPRRIQQDMAVVHPAGTLALDPPRDSDEALRLEMFKAINQIRDKIGGYLVKAGYGTPEQVDREIERVMREAVAEAAEWVRAPEKMTSKLQIRRAISSARSEFGNLPLIGGGGDGHSGGASISR